MREIYTFLIESLSGKAPTEKISQIEMMMKPIRNSCISLPFTVSRESKTLTIQQKKTIRKRPHLRPTAALFLSDRHIKNSVEKMAMKQSNMEPNWIW